MKNIRKLLKLVLVFTFILLILSLVNINSKITYSLSEENEIISDEYGTYEDAKKIVKEVMKDYYIRGPQMQYNFAKTSYGLNSDNGLKSPEEGTSQDILHSVCDAYSYYVYSEAFGIRYKIDNFPKYDNNVIEVARNYYKKNKNNNDALNGNFLIYYENKDGDKYVYNNLSNISDVFQIIQPGDIFGYTGHVMIAYDVVERNVNNKIVKDVLMLHSSGGESIKSRIYSTSYLAYHLFSSDYGLNQYLDMDVEGNIKYFWLSERTDFVNNGNLSCKSNRNECVIIRPYYNNNGKAMFNYKINKESYKKSILRTKYPGLLIEKTVNVGDNNSVYLDDELIYTIKITNKSNVTYDGAKYSSFSIKEIVGEEVSYDSSNNAAVYDEENKTITWNISNLDFDQSVELSYKVKVKHDLNNIGKSIEAEGIFYDGENVNVSIKTGVVKNKIIPKLNNKLSKSYEECYNDNKDTYSGLNLIDKVYKCSRDYNFNFVDFNFNDIFVKNDVEKKTTFNGIKLKEDSSSLVFKNMILNNYYNGLVKLKVKNESNVYVLPDGIQTYILPRWSEDVEERAKIINSIDFKDGDVLIYSVDYSKTTKNLIHTKEDGLYAYIYINGKFIGNNYSNNDTKKRNEFVYNYYNDIDIDLKSHLYTGVDKLDINQKKDVLTFANYQTLYDKDNYVILRPELVIKEVDNISIEEISKTKYIKNKENLDLKGSKIKVYYNDNTTETIVIDENNINQFEVSGFDNINVGTNIVTIKYHNVIETFNVNIVSEQKYIIHKYMFNEINNYISKIDVNTTITEFKKNIELNDGYIIDVEIKNIDNKDVLYTGGKTKIFYNNTIDEELTNIVSGDTNGDGKINYLDYVNVYNHIQKEKHPESSKNLLENEYKIAADMSYDNKISYLDYVMIYNKIKDLKGKTN